MRTSVGFRKGLSENHPRAVRGRPEVVDLVGVAWEMREPFFGAFLLGCDVLIEHQALYPIDAVMNIILKNRTVLCGARLM